jgi:hypothetical protein
MDIDRRKLVAGTACLALTKLFRPEGAGDRANAVGIPVAPRRHPVTRSLLERAWKVDRDREVPDTATIEQAILTFAKASGYAGSLVINWMETPADAFDHLSRLGLDALLDMGSASLWRRVPACNSR